MVYIYTLIQHIITYTKYGSTSYMMSFTPQYTCVLLIIRRTSSSSSPSPPLAHLSLPLPPSINARAFRPFAPNNS